ncbi:RHS repeat-associated core domain-containing protein [Pseudomonas triticifolii]|uniref:RHS repeat-associated core domain-containing protein n=1 Tax=Pseudomonas triticifolii TaxID=2762592 RepID=A0ABR7BL72_9PSED|nr:RHS repeat-associated core domain-containing protein [Pseudomonas triticifolii]MBC3957941.1 RHS repeat-associated core domain-containing protein [Pseudomonas triticifolii]
MTILCTYTYDPLDRIATLGPLAQALTQRFYCERRMITELQGGLQWTVLQAGGHLLAQRNRDADGESIGLIATDQQNSALGVTTAAQQTDIAYSPYGHREADLSGAALPGFTGAQPERVTGHYVLGNGYRAFNPTLMRFNSPDSLSPFGKGGVNAYAYCVGDPINRIDPTGHLSFISLGAIAGLILTTAGIGSAVASAATKESNPELAKPLMIAGIVTAALGVAVLGGSVGAALVKRAASRPSALPVGPRYGARPRHGAGQGRRNAISRHPDSPDDLPPPTYNQLFELESPPPSYVEATRKPVRPIEFVRSSQIRSDQIRSDQIRNSSLSVIQAVA